MFFSHQHSLHHNPGSLPSTLLASDPTKAHPVSLPSKLHSANQRTTSALTQHSSSKFLPTPASIRAGIGSKAAAQQQAHQTSSTTTATAFASRNTFHPSGGGGGPTAANQSRFAATLNGSAYRTAPGGPHLGTSVPIPPVANTGSINTGATFTKNTPAVKFLFKKPQLPATLSSSAALYHFSNHSPTSGQTNGGATISNSSAGTSLSKFSIPKLNSSASSGDVASCPTSCKPFSSNGSPLDQQARPTHYSHHATNGRPNSGGAFTPSSQHVSPSSGQQQPPSGTLSSHQLALLKYQQHQLTYGAPSKSKGASSVSSSSKSSSKSSSTVSYSGHKEAYNQQNELKSTSSKVSSWGGLAGSSSSNASSASSVRTSINAAASAQLSGKGEQSSSKHSSKVFSAASALAQSSQHNANNGSRPSSGASFAKDTAKSEAAAKERLSLSAVSFTKKESSASVNKSSKSTSRAESSSSSSNSKKAIQEKKKSSKSGLLAADYAVLSPAPGDTGKDDKKSAKVKKDRDRSASKLTSCKVKVDDETTNGSSTSSKKHKKDKEKNKKEKKRKRKVDQSSDDDSEDSDASEEDDRREEAAVYAKSKAKRRRHNSSSSTSSFAGAGHDSRKASPAHDTTYLYHPQAAASMAKGAMASDTSAKLYSGNEALSAAERTKQKLLADSMGGHFPALLHNSKLSGSPSSIFTAASFTTVSGSAHHSHSHSLSPSLASPPLLGSPSPTPKLISSKNSHLHEDSNGSTGSAGSGTGGGGLISKKETASSSKKLSKMSKDVLNNSSGTEKSQLMSTTIKYREDNRVTTIEIKQINKEKTWDNSNEIKKHKTTKESSKSSSSKLLTNGAASGKQSSQPSSKGANLADSTKLSASNSSLSSVASSTTKKSKKSSVEKKKHSEEATSSKKSSKKSKLLQEESVRKQKKKRDRSLSPGTSLGEKMPPPPPTMTVSYPGGGGGRSKHGDYESALTVGKGQFGKAERHRSQSPALSMCSSSSEVSPYVPTKALSTGKKSKKSKAEAYQQERQLASAKAQLKARQQQRKSGRHSDCDNEDMDEEDDKMSISSSMSVSSSASSVSARSASSSASSHSASSASSVELKGASQATTAKRVVSKEFSQKDSTHHRHHSKSSYKLKKLEQTTSKGKAGETPKEETEPFEFTQAKYSSKFTPETKLCSSKAKLKRELFSEDDSGSDSDSSASDSDSEHSDHYDAQRKTSKAKNSQPKVTLAHSSDSEDEPEQQPQRIMHPAKSLSPYKPALLASPVASKSANKESTLARKEDTKKNRKAGSKAKESLDSVAAHVNGGTKKKGSAIQQGQSLLAPLTAKSSSRSASSAIKQGRKYSPAKRTGGGYTGLSDSDSSMDEEDDDHSKLERHRSPPAEVFRDRSKSLPTKHKSVTNKQKQLSDCDLSSQSSSSSESEASASEEELEEEAANRKRHTSTNSNTSTPRPPTAVSLSPQTTPNGRLPASNIYSRASAFGPGVGSPFERLYQNISSGYGTERHSSLSPPLPSTSMPLGDIREIHSRLAQLVDSDLLQQVVDLVEGRNSSCFHIVNNCLQFDLLKLDQVTLLEIRRLIC